MRVLLLDDDPEISAYLSSALRKAGHLVDTYTTPKVPLQNLQPGSYDCLVTDLDMPEFTGIDVIREAKRILGNIFIVAMSGHRPDKSNYLRAATWSGANATLVKPFQAQQLVALLANPNIVPQKDPPSFGSGVVITN